MALFESYERRIDQIKPVMEKYGIKDFEDALKICTDKGFNPYEIVKGVQPICFENAAWAYTLGAAIAIKKGCTKAADAAKAIGEGLQAFCIPGSVADDRKVGLGHGNLASMLLSEDTKCFAFLAGHESFAAAEGAIGIAKSANKVRKEPLRVILNGLGKDAAQVISRINGFTYVKTDFDFFTGKVKVLEEIALNAGKYDSSVSLIQDYDIMEIVNELVMYGAEAISVNGQRITNLTSIKSSGPIIKINGVNTTAPFVIEAIGDPDTLEASIALKDGKVDELRNLKIDITITKEDIKLRGYEGTTSLRYATPVEKGGK